MTVDLRMAYKPMLMSITLTLMQGHSGSAKTKNVRWFIVTTTGKQAISIQFATTVGHFLMWPWFRIYFIWLGHLVSLWDRTSSLQTFYLQTTIFHSCNISLQLWSIRPLLPSKYLTSALSPSTLPQCNLWPRLKVGVTFVSELTCLLF